MDYLELIKEIWELDRVHSSPQMRKAYSKVASFYEGATLLEYPAGAKCGAMGSWTVPQSWKVNHAMLKGPSGETVCSYDETPLRLFAYSPAFKGSVSLEELNGHLMSNPLRPNAIPFHFRNQYRPWERDWGFCLTENEKQNLVEGDYFVDIDVEFVDDPMVQLEMTKEGETDKRILFVGHFDHPAMINDGLAGCIAANEVIRRLAGRKTRFTYVSLNAVEIVGSTAYCSFEKEKIKKTEEALFVALAGNEAPFAYQTSNYPQGSLIDRVIKHMLKWRQPEALIGGFREIMGNDEISFETPGVSIPCGSILRWPLEEYHTSDDNFENFSPEAMEETIAFLLDFVEILEENKIVEPLFEGLPCFSHPDLDLYLPPAFMSQMRQDHKSDDRLTMGLSPNEIEFLKENPDAPNQFMNKLPSALSRSEPIDVLSLSEDCGMPFRFVSNYLSVLSEKNLLKLG